MTGIFATAGASISIGQPLAQQAADFVESDFDGQSWVDINWWQNAGEFGDEANAVPFDSIGRQRTSTLKGTRSAGNQVIVFGVDTDDDGQATLLGAETERFDYAFRITFNDAPSGGTPSRRYFIAKVMTAREQMNEANTVVMLTATLGINSNIVRVNASA